MLAFHILPSIGQLVLEEIKSMHVGNMVASLAKAGKAVTANHCRRLLYSALEAAIADDLIHKNPVKYVKPGKSPYVSNSS